MSRNVGTREVVQAWGRILAGYRPNISIEITIEWAQIPRLQLVVSIDGLQPEHDIRRTPATYDRILKHIEGHQITVHCTVTRQQVRREGYLEEFLRMWDANPNTRLI